MLPGIPLTRIGKGSLQPQDILFFYLLITTLIWPKLKGKEWVRTPLNKPIFIFFLAVLFSGIISKLFLGGDFWLIRREWRRYSYYLVFFIVLNRIKNKEEVYFLLKTIIGMAIFSSICSILYGMFGYKFPLPWNYEMSGQILDESQEVLRIGAPGGENIYIATIVIVCILVLGNRKDIKQSLSMILILIPLIISIIIGLTRHFWISMTLTLCVLFILISSGNKSRMIKYLVCTFGILLILFSFSGIGKISSYGETASKRLGTIFKEELWEEDSTMVDRYRENHYAWGKIKDNPILGIGLGNEYREKFYRQDVGTRGVHNAYLHIWLYLGLPGLVSFLYMSFLFLVRSLRNWRKVKNPALRPVVIGFGLSYFGMMISNFVAPFFIQSWTVAIFGTMMATNEVIYKIEGIR